MKKLMMIATLIVMVGALASPAYAVTQNSAPISISASVDSTLALTVAIFKDSATGPTGSQLAAIDFGQLQVFTNTSTGGQTLRSSDTGTGAIMGGAVALVTANSHGAHYLISQTGTALTGTGGTIPTGACRMVPFYSPNDKLGGVNQGPMPAGAAIGGNASWVTSGTANTIYNSEASNTQVRIAQAHFSITDDPSTGSSTAVQVNQSGGSYSGSITFTVVSP